MLFSLLFTTIIVTTTIIIFVMTAIIIIAIGIIKIATVIAIIIIMIPTTTIAHNIYNAYIYYFTKILNHYAVFYLKDEIILLTVSMYQSMVTPQ